MRKSGVDASAMVLCLSARQTATDDGACRQPHGHDGALCMTAPIVYKENPTDVPEVLGIDRRQRRSHEFPL